VPQIKIMWVFQNAHNLYFKLCVSQGRSFIRNTFTLSYSILNKLFLISNLKWINPDAL
jgi:hypothetical protein